MFCAYAQMSEQESQEHVTVHLSPYQSAPFDLHVGFEVRNTTGGFYARRQHKVKLFLDKIESLRDQEVSDLIYDSIASRVQYMNTNKQKDPFLDRDMLQIRTLSAIAAGFGGKQLASIFRCFFFDYRHYSGGLPDLHLLRAAIVDPCQTTDGEVTLVDLGEWIGESFSQENQNSLAAHQAAAILCDRDDEFLGCSKVGDSGGQASRFSRNGKLLSNASMKATDQSKIPSLDSLPDKLQLEHKGHAVRVECMMVEVKSSNDRLDPRQEDWLNILDRYGNARVCKFESKRKT
jgi:VRR-NUC domain